ncbi:hypothetical protein A45J_0384 [hot springs metagenome]|uniref:Uncharacterized protein n=1 Tax=hot springs metagenome TaxID=433727 RepID=A0A5J4L577_9ZZZZ
MKIIAQNRSQNTEDRIQTKDILYGIAGAIAAWGYIMLMYAAAVEQ